MKFKLPRLRFSLKGLCVAVTIIAAAFAWLLASQRELDRQLQIVQSINGASDVRLFAVRSVGFEDPTPINNEDVAKLAALPDIEELYLPGAQIDDEAAKSIAEMKKLRVLVIQNTGITDAGLEAISSLPELEELRMSSCQISDAGCENLADMKSLTRLGLWNTDVSNGSTRHFAGLSHLRELNIAMTLISNDGLESISSSLPNCEIIHWGNRVRDDRISDRSSPEMR